MINYFKNCYKLTKQLDQLKADNDSLKSELMQTNCYLEADKETIDQLKKENEELKQRLHQCWKVEYSFVEQLDQLKEKNGELKKQTCGLRPELKHIVDKTCCKYNINAKYYHEKIVEIINNLDKYKQTLIEIKEIAEKYKNLNFGEQQYCYSEILKKIKECEAENENRKN